jgi:hypothetical protein
VNSLLGQLDDDEDSDQEGDDSKKPSEGPNKNEHSSSKIGGDNQDGYVTVGYKYNKCELVWQGTLPKRSFTGFKFQVQY